MVEVDLPWAYGVGASFAVVAQRHLLASAGPHWRNGLLSWPFIQVLFFCLIMLEPFTVQLLWAFPEWQLMYLIHGRPGIWQVAAILIALVAMAMLGFAVAWTLLRQGRPYGAYLQFIAGYLLLFFGLSYGWDGTGYQRLLSVDRAALAHWTWVDAGTWLHSDIFAVYNVHMAVLVPFLLFFASYWVARDSRPRRGQVGVVAWLILLVFGATLGTALLGCVILLHLGVILGAPSVALLALLLMYWRRGPFRLLHQAIFAPLART
jgi:hypothetical protein